MDEDKLADLNDIQDFFNRSHSTSASGTFCTESIGIKDFIGWCNDPCKILPKTVLIVTQPISWATPYLS